MKQFLLLTSVVVLLSCHTEQPRSYDYLYQDIPFEMSKLVVPTFPDHQVSINDYGGVGDGLTLNTEAFAKAMDALAEKGGGKLIIPPGVWFTGPITFQSNINLHLQKGAVILFTPDMNAYPLVNSFYEGQESRRCQSPVSGRNLENIAITGEGIINGSGEAWHPLKKGKVTEDHWEEVVNSGGVLKNPGFWFPSESALKGELLIDQKIAYSGLTEAQWDSIKDYLRPVMLSFIECRNIFLQGVLFENSPSWNIHPLMCENVIVDGVFIRNPGYAQNGDGIDLESCKNVIIVNSTLDVGDDAICLKSGKDEEGRKRNRPTENVLIDNCIVFQGHGGFVVGSEMSGGVRNISVKNCRFIGTDIGLRFKSCRGRGGVVENIYAENISMINIKKEPFLFDLFYGSTPPSKASATTEDLLEPVTEATPVFRNIQVKNIVSRNAHRAMFFNGLPEMNISNVRIENSVFTATVGAELSEAEDVCFKNVKVIARQGEPLILNNVRNFRTEGSE